MRKHERCANVRKFVLPFTLTLFPQGAGRGDRLHYPNGYSASTT